MSSCLNCSKDWNFCRYSQLFHLTPWVKHIVCIDGVADSSPLATATIRLKSKGFFLQFWSPLFCFESADQIASQPSLRSATARSRTAATSAAFNCKAVTQSFGSNLLQRRVVFFHEDALHGNRAMWHSLTPEKCLWNATGSDCPE